MKYISLLLLCILIKLSCFAQLDDKTVVLSAKPKMWYAFPLNDVRLLESSPFHKAMKVDEEYMIGIDVERMLNRFRRSSGLATINKNYPGSFQPDGTRPGYIDHYLSAISIMYAQTGDERFKQRADYIIQTIKACNDTLAAKQQRHDTTIHPFRQPRFFADLLKGKVMLDGPDETGYPWGGAGNSVTNDFYGIHKMLAAYRDAYLYCNNKDALQLMIDEADSIAAIVLHANPDLFDNVLDAEHGGMNEVFADLYALTGNKKYMDVSMRFNHQKVILNIADNKDVLYGRHVNMQVPTFVGTARQYQLTGDKVCGDATRNFLDIMYKYHNSCIGGSGRCERYLIPGDISKTLGFTADETCVTYNMLKVALNEFELSGELKHMDYFERALYNHILASQDPQSGGVTYYTSLAPGGFKSYSKVYDLDGVWCCVGTGMENHAKYGEAIYFHNNNNLFVNLFIPSQLTWKEKGLKVELATKFPEEDNITLTVKENTSFRHQLYIRYPLWAQRGVKIFINNEQQDIDAQPGGYIRLAHAWKAGDKIIITMPQGFHFESTQDDPSMVAILQGPIVMAGELGAGKMPGSDLVRNALQWNGWQPVQNDIPTLIVNKQMPQQWIKPLADSPLHYSTVQAGFINDSLRDIRLLPFYKTHHQRYTVYFKMYSHDEIDYRKDVVSDEINIKDFDSEKLHNLQAENSDTSVVKDQRHFWENNRKGRSTKQGGWFSYDMKIDNTKQANYLVVTYWGDEEAQHEFEVLVDDTLVKKENLAKKHPLTYYEEVYELPSSTWKNKKKITVKFKADANNHAGAVYALKIMSDTKNIADYSFY